MSTVRLSQGWLGWALLWLPMLAFPLVGCLMAFTMTLIAVQNAPLFWLCLILEIYLAGYLEWRLFLWLRSFRFGVTIDTQNRLLWSYGKDKVPVTGDETVVLRRMGRMKYVELTVAGSRLRFIPEFFISFDITDYGVQTWWKRLWEAD